LQSLAGVNNSPSVLIVRLDAIGDALALVPLLAALRQRGAKVDVVLSPQNAGVFSKEAVNAVYTGDAANLVAKLADNAYDYALIATEDAGGYRLARAMGARRRIGFENGWGKPLKTLWARLLCTRTVHRTAGLDPRAPHESQVLFTLGGDIVGDLQPSRDATILRRFVVDAAPAPDERIVMQITAKWDRLGASIRDVVDLASRLKQRHAMRFVAAENERDYAQRFAAQADVTVEYFTELAPWKNAIASAKALVAPDSGAVHVAGMTGTPVVAVFAAAHFALQTGRWSPWAAPYRVVKIENGWPISAENALEDLVRDKPAIHTG
jgi:ADP-heptose:LPS heptosyltransferase